MGLRYLPDTMNHIQPSGFTRVRLGEVSVAIRVAGGSERRHRRLLQFTRRSINTKYSWQRAPNRAGPGSLHRPWRTRHCWCQQLSRNASSPCNPAILQCKSHLHEDLYDLYWPSVIRLIRSRMLRKIRHVISSGEWRSKYKFLVRKPEGKPPFGRPKRRRK